MIKKNSFYKSGLLSALLVVLFQFSGCEVINPDEEIPSYLYIPKITLNTDYPSQGSNSNGIADGWVYVDDYLIKRNNKITCHRS